MSGTSGRDRARFHGTLDADIKKAAFATARKQFPPGTRCSVSDLTTGTVHEHLDDRRAVILLDGGGMLIVSFTSLRPRT